MCFIAGEVSSNLETHTLIFTLNTQLPAPVPDPSYTITSRREEGRDAPEQDRAQAPMIRTFCPLEVCQILLWSERRREKMLAFV